jgi:MATE family multidrug resistance protein
VTIHRRVWRMAGPIILSNVSVPLLGAVDTAVVGHLPEAYYIGAVGIGAMIFNFIYFGFNCLRMGTTAPTAQAAGAGDWTEVRGMLGRALFIALTVGVCLLALQSLIVGFAFGMIDASAEVEDLGSRYFLIRVWAVPAALSTYVIIGWFYGLQDARIPLVLQVSANVINIILDLLFVFVFDWGVEGVAAASVIAEYTGLGLGFYYVRRRLKAMPGGEVAPRIFDLVKLRRILTLNGFIFFRTLCVVSGMAIFMAQGARLGDLPLAANQVLYNFLQFTAFGLDGLAHAAEALIGQAIGRRSRAAFGEAVRAVLLWSGVVAGLNVLIYWVTGTAIIALMTNIPEVRVAAEMYLPWAIAMPAVAVWAYAYDGIFLGATRADVMLVSMLLSFAVYMTAMYTLLPGLDNHALWIALMVFLGFRGLTLMVFYPKLRRAVGEGD